MAMGRAVRGRGSAARLRPWLVVVGLSTSLAAAAVVASVAAGKPSSAAHLTAQKAPEASTVPPTTMAPAASGSGQAAVPRTPAVTTTLAPSAPPATPHFDTPQAAMIYLASAWNARDAAALGHVTTPAARVQLDAMRSGAVNLRLDHCDRQIAGDYLCYFKHDFPTGKLSGPAGAGAAIFLVAPALRPGWYMTVLETCG
jgi:hypothetical protein